MYMRVSGRDTTGAGSFALLVCVGCVCVYVTTHQSVECIPFASLGHNTGGTSIGCHSGLHANGATVLVGIWEVILVPVLHGTGSLYCMVLMSQLPDYGALFGEANAEALDCLQAAT